MSKIATCYQMVLECISIIESNGFDFEEAFIKFLDYCSINLYLESNAVFELKEESMRMLDAKFDLQVLKQAKHDVIGEVYYNHSGKKRGKTSDVSDLYKRKRNGFPAVVFVGSVGTGADLIDKDKNVIVYTTSSDIVTYHISLINRALYDLPLFSLYYSSKNKDNKYDLSLSSSNWEFANRWQPVKTCHLV